MEFLLQFNGYPRGAELQTRLKLILCIRFIATWLSYLLYLGNCNIFLPLGGVGLNEEAADFDDSMVDDDRMFKYFPFSNILFFLFNY